MVEARNHPSIRRPCSHLRILQWCARTPDAVCCDSSDLRVRACVREKAELSFKTTLCERIHWRNYQRSDFDSGVDDEDEFARSFWQYLVCSSWTAHWRYKAGEQNLQKIF